jgi:glucokinase
MSNKKVKPILAVDLGGTKKRLALVSSGGTVISSKQSLTLAEKGYRDVIRRMILGIRSILKASGMGTGDIQGVSVAAAGIIDTRNGIITISPSLPDWRNVYLKDIMFESLGIDIFLINDASAAALGEFHYGAGKGIDNLIYITVSTGIGGGIIIDRKLYLGVDGCAGEIGHMVIEANGPLCNCGNYGCLEILASGTAIAREARKRVKQGDITILSNLHKRVPNITAKDVFVAANKGDSVSFEVLNTAAFYLGIGMANIVNIFNPEMIVVGGGVSKMGNILLNPAREVVKQRAFTLPTNSVRIVKSKLGADSGIIGAALYLLRNRREI